MKGCDLMKPTTIHEILKYFGLDEILPKENLTQELIVELLRLYYSELFE